MSDAGGSGLEPFGVFDQTPIARYLADVIDMALFGYMQTVRGNIDRHVVDDESHRVAMGTAVATFRRWKPEHENEAAESVCRLGPRCPIYADSTMRRMATVLRAAGAGTSTFDGMTVHFPRLVRHVYTSLAVDPYILSREYFAQTPDAYFARRTVHRRALLHALEMGCHDPACWRDRRDRRDLARDPTVTITPIGSRLEPPSGAHLNPTVSDHVSECSITPDDSISQVNHV